MSSGEILAEMILEGDQDFQQGMEGAGQSMEEAGNSAETSAGQMGEMEQSLIQVDQAGVAAGATIASVGGAMEKTLQDTKSTREELGRVSVNMGITSDEANELATSISNATFPMEDATATMNALAQEGVESEEQMKNLATEMDTLADATGRSAEEITNEVGPALRAMGEDIENASEHTDTFTFVQQETSAELEDFTGLLERFGPQMREAGISTEDAAAMIAAMEEEGIQGREAMQRLREAADSGAESQEEFAEVLGISQESIEEQGNALEDSSGMAEEYAEAANESVTTTDKLRQKFDEFKLQAAGVLGPIDSLAPALMGLGSAQSLVATINTSALIPSITGVVTAMGPLLPAILAISAVIGGLALAWKNNWGDIRGKTKAAINFLKGLLDSLIGFVTGAFEFITGVFTGFNPAEILNRKKEQAIGVITSLFETGKELFSQGVETLKTLILDFTLAGILWKKRDEAIAAVTDLWNTGEQLFDQGVETVQQVILNWTLPGLIWQYRDEAINAVTDLWNTGEQKFDQGVQALQDILLGWAPDQPVQAAKETILDKLDFVGEMKERGKELLSSFAEGIREKIPDVGGVVDDMAGSIRDKLPFSDAKEGPLSDLSSTGPAFIRTIKEGIKDKIPDLMDTVDDVVGGVRDKLPFSDAKEGPLSDLSSTGPAFMHTIADGMEQERDVVATEAEQTAELMSPDPEEPDTPVPTPAPASTSGEGGGDSQTVQIDARIMAGAVKVLGGLTDEAREEVRSMMEDLQDEQIREIERLFGVSS